MAVDYDEGRRLLAGAEKARTGTLGEWADAERSLDKFLRTHAEALLNPDPWRGIEEAPKDVWLACRRPSLTHPSGFWVAMLIYLGGHWCDVNGQAFEPHHYLPTSAN